MIRGRYSFFNVSAMDYRLRAKVLIEAEGLRYRFVVSDCFSRGLKFLDINTRLFITNDSVYNFQLSFSI